MPLPAFTIDGVLPAYTGPSGPGGAAEDMSPYVVSSMEVAATFGVTDGRKAILRGWLQYRAALRTIGFTRGFQWLDGSFVEQKEPRDLDVVTFLYRPPGISDSQLRTLLMANLSLFNRDQVKSTYKLDSFIVDLNGSPEGLVNGARYYLGLFSHRRGDDLWKGMLSVRLEDVSEDQASLTMLGPEPSATLSEIGA